jgi:hypothetical protein
VRAHSVQFMLTVVNTRSSIGSMSRARHPNKHIEDAVQHAESLGWRVHASNGHAWAIISCPFGERGGCGTSVWSTPKVPENHARHIRRDVDKCPQAQTETQVEEREADDNRDQNAV